MLHGSMRAVGNRKIVFIHAGGKAYYTTPNKADSIKYIGQDLHITVAFADQGKAGTVINK